MHTDYTELLNIKIMTNLCFSKVMVYQTVNRYFDTSIAPLLVFFYKICFICGHSIRKWEYITQINNTYLQLIQRMKWFCITTHKKWINIMMFIFDTNSCAAALFSATILDFACIEMWVLYYYYQCLQSITVIKIIRAWRWIWRINFELPR